MVCFVEMFFPVQGNFQRFQSASLPPGLPDGDGYHDMILPCGLFQEIPSRSGGVA